MMLHRLVLKHYLENYSKEDNYMQLDIYQVDAFANKLFEGNPAAVCPLDFWPEDELLQSIALENNLSETAFYVPDEGGFHLRWFTPATEVRLCGHATLATAHILFNELNQETDSIHFNTLSGMLSVSKMDNGQYIMDFPSDHPEKVIDQDIKSKIHNVLNAEVKEYWKGKDDYLIILENDEDIIDLQPDFRAIAQLQSRGLIVTAPSNKISCDFISRGFFPQCGIDEDPATGSAHTLLTPYWSPRLKTNKLKAIQWSQRKGYFECIYKGKRTALIGKAITFMKGKIEV